jgi:hypothetical protein
MEWRWVLVPMDAMIVDENPGFEWDRYAIAWVLVEEWLLGAPVEHTKSDVVQRHAHQMTAQRAGDHFSAASGVRRDRSLGELLDEALDIARAVRALPHLVMHGNPLELRVIELKGQSDRLREDVGALADRCEDLPPPSASSTSRRRPGTTWRSPMLEPNERYVGSTTYKGCCSDGNACGQYVCARAHSSAASHSAGSQRMRFSPARPCGLPPARHRVQGLARRRRAGHPRTGRSDWYGGLG